MLNLPGYIGDSISWQGIGLRYLLEALVNVST